jgi:lysophospholipase L1-like esterase
MNNLLSIFFCWLIQVTFTPRVQHLNIYPDDDRIEYRGAMFVIKNKHSATLDRFNPSIFQHKKTHINKEKAATQSGVSISFKTDSPFVKFVFEKRINAPYRQLIFSVLKDGKFHSEIRNHIVKVENDALNKLIEWEVVMPTFYGLDFKGIEIAKNAVVSKVIKDNRKVYFAIGNSITHGVGQKGNSLKTYPSIIARAKNWSLFNLAVGGSKISWPLAPMLKDHQADIITVLWGYNDWNSPLSLEKDIIPNYDKLIRELRTFQPQASIYCILPTTSKRTYPKNGKISLEDIRNAQREILLNFQNEGDKNLFIIDGSKITSIEDLNDDVHLSIQGAQNFADKLIPLLNNQQQG